MTSDDAARELLFIAGCRTGSLAGGRKLGLDSPTPLEVVNIFMEPAKRLQGGKMEREEEIRNVRR
jgi:hypothetical protein